MSNSISHKGRQRKGRQFELWVLKRLWEAVGRPWPWKHQRPDDGHRPPPEFEVYHVECKRQERLNWWAAIQQAIADCNSSGRDRWVVVSKSNRCPAVAVVALEDWISLVTAARDLEDKV